MPAIIASTFVGCMLALAAFMTSNELAILILAASGACAFLTHNEDFPLIIRQAFWMGGILLALVATISIYLYR